MDPELRRSIVAAIEARYKINRSYARLHSFLNEASDQGFGENGPVPGGSDGELRKAVIAGLSSDSRASDHEELLRIIRKLEPACRRAALLGQGAMKVCEQRSGEIVFTFELYSRTCSLRPHEVQAEAADFERFVDTAMSALQRSPPEAERGWRLAVSTGRA